VIGIDRDAELVLGRADRARNLELREVTIGDARLPETFEVAACADVEDDETAVIWLVEHLRSGGWLVLHVPATLQRHAIRSVTPATRRELASGLIDISPQPN
jgi:trans-aconitate methyltransferase